MDETDRTTGEFTDEEDDARRSSVFAELKPYCVELLELLQNPTTKHSSAIPALLQLLRSSHPSALQPFFEYAPFLTFTFTYMLPFVYTNNSFWFSVTWILMNKYCIVVIFNYVLLALIPCQIWLYLVYHFPGWVWEFGDQM